MFSHRLLAGVLACAVAAAGGLAQASDFHADVQLKPIIIEASSQSDPQPGTKASVYPAGARKAGVEGAAILRCNIQPEARFGDCKVLEEYPEGAGFADIALAITPRIQQPVPGGRNGGPRISGTALVPFQFMIQENEAKTLGDRVVWERRPTPEQMGTAYPFVAGRDEIEGEAVIECKVGLDGLLTDCRALREAPYGWGFREGAMKVMSFFKARSTLKDGAPLPDGASIRVPVRFVTLRTVLKELHPR